MISLPIHRTITLVKCTHPSLFSCTTTPEIRHCNCTFHCKRGRFVYWICTLVPCPSVCLTVILKCTIKSQTAGQTTKTHITHVLIPIGHSILLPHTIQSNSAASITRKCSDGGLLAAGETNHLIYCAATKHH